MVTDLVGDTTVDNSSFEICVPSANVLDHPHICHQYCPRTIDNY